MKFYKYLFLLISLLITSEVFALCPHPAQYPGQTNLNPAPTTICAPRDGGGGFCKLKVDWVGEPINLPCTNPQGCSSSPSYPLGLSSMSDRVYRNSDCTVELQEGCTQLPNGNIECEEEEEEENDPVLQCTADSCLNPENKRCPTGYTGGSFNGQSMCVKNNKPDPECEGDECEEDHDSEVVAAVNDANNSITGAISDLNNSLRGILNQIKNVLSDISEKVRNQGDDDGDDDGDCENGCGQGGETGEVDTSPLEAEAPFIESYDSDNSQFETDLFESNSQCPADQVLNMSFMGSTLHYAFSYVEICDALHGLSFLVMIFAYLIAAHIVTRA